MSRDVTGVAWNDVRVMVSIKHLGIMLTAGLLKVVILIFFIKLTLSFKWLYREGFINLFIYSAQNPGNQIHNLTKFNFYYVLLNLIILNLLNP